MTIIERLNEMRNHGGQARTTGLPDEVIVRFAGQDERLLEAIEMVLVGAEAAAAVSPARFLEMGPAGRVRDRRRGGPVGRVHGAYGIRR